MPRSQKPAARKRRPAQNSAPKRHGRRQTSRRYPLWPGLLLLALVSLILLYQNRPLQAADPLDWRAYFPLIRQSETEPVLPTGLPDPDGTTTYHQDPSEPTAESTQENPTPRPPVAIQLVAVGDLLMHRPITDGALVEDSGPEPVYDFRPNFQYIQPMIAASDIVMFNLETTLAGPPYSGFPFFSAPDALGEALLDTGFNVAVTANNHILDKGIEGFLRTTQVLQDQGHIVIGTRLDPQQPRDALIEVGGYQIGLTAYTFETIGTETQRTLNSLPIPDEILPLLNSFNPYRPDIYQQDLALMLEHVAELKQRGADYICFVMHWGEEYQTTSRPYQREMARYLVDAGVDLIIGHHPHVLQEIDLLYAADTGRPGLVFYSLGNLVTNMTYEMLGLEGKTQDGMIARVNLLADDQGVRLVSADYIPTHVVRVPKNRGWQHFVIPVLQALEDPDGFPTTSSVMRASLKRIESILTELPDDPDIPVRQTAR